MDDIIIILTVIYVLIGVGIMSAVMTSLSSKLHKDNLLYTIVAVVMAIILGLLWPGFVAYVLFSPTPIKR